MACLSAAEQRYQLQDLLYLMQRLRDPEHGCPWDLKQDYASIVPHTLEEAYEVADVIEREAWSELPGELGDLLFQVVYYAQFAQEQRRFEFADVVHTVTAKLVRRHPHVFPAGTLYGAQDAPRLSEQQIKQRWEQIKAEERAEREAQAGERIPQQLSLLDDIPQGLPALTRAVKLQKRAASGGFDWDQLPPVFAKLQEEIAEVEQAVRAQDATAIQDEIGDVLFSVVNLARHLSVDPEQALRQAGKKFEQRFRSVEQQAEATGKRLSDFSLVELEAFWQLAKQAQ